MKQLLRFVSIIGLGVAASCGHTAALPSAAPAAIAKPGSFPPTVHVIPFYNFNKSGYSVPAGTGYGGFTGSAAGLYGATILGGSTTCSTPFDGGSNTGCGIVYRLVRLAGKKYKLDVLHTFEGGPNDGAASYSTVLPDKNGDLYLTTFYGGKYNKGTVLKLHPTSSSYTATVLHSFGHGKDGAYPPSGVIEVNGMLYGTTLGGGAQPYQYLCLHYGGGLDGKCGTVYQVDPATGHERVLHSFGARNDGASPWTALLNVGGSLYGTTDLGGTSKYCGTVFSIGTNGKHEKVVHSFGNNPDGCNPLANLIAVHGTLYGTTCCGGRTYCQNHCNGTLYSVDVATGNEKVLHDFGNGSDGSQPHAAVADLGGVLYGTTDIGGGTSCFSGDGCGTIFSYAPSTSNPVYTVLYDFQGKADGAGPAAPLFYSHGAFYSTTTTGGKNGLGTGIKVRL